jgi:hypothetical protein
MGTLSKKATTNVSELTYKCTKNRGEIKSQWKRIYSLNYMKITKKRLKK